MPKYTNASNPYTKIQHKSLSPTISFKFKEITFAVDNLPLENGSYAVPPKTLIFDWLYMTNRFCTDYGYSSLSWNRIVSISWTAAPLRPSSVDSSWRVEDPFSFKVKFQFDPKLEDSIEIIQFDNGKPLLTTFLPKSYWDRLIEYLHSQNNTDKVNIQEMYTISPGVFNIKTSNGWYTVTKDTVNIYSESEMIYGTSKN